MIVFTDSPRDLASSFFESYLHIKLLMSKLSINPSLKRSFSLISDREHFPQCWSRQLFKPECSLRWFHDNTNQGVKKWNWDDEDILSQFYRISFQYKGTSFSVALIFFLTKWQNWNKNKKVFSEIRSKLKQLL